MVEGTQIHTFLLFLRRGCWSPPIFIRAFIYLFVSVCLFILFLCPGERPYPCSEPGCCKTFVRNEELTRHRRIHSGERPYVCGTCCKAFTRKDHLNKHLRVHALGLPEWQHFTCPWRNFHVAEIQLPLHINNTVFVFFFSQESRKKNLNQVECV